MIRTPYGRACPVRVPTDGRAYDRAETKGKPMLDLVKPDLGKLVYLAIGFLLLPKLIRFVK